MSNNGSFLRFFVSFVCARMGACVSVCLCVSMPVPVPVHVPVCVCACACACAAFKGKYC